MQRLMMLIVVLSSLHPWSPVWAGTNPPQPRLGATPGITVITAAEIRANGYHTLAEALRWLRGVYLGNDHTYDYLGVRGVQRPGDYNSRVRIAIDGHSMTGNVYGDAYLGPELGLDLERVERIEVSLGPGTADLGENSVLAAVNVITRAPKSEGGVGVSAWTGGASERRGALSLDTARPDWPALALSASWLDQNGLDLYDTAFDDLGIDGSRAAGERAGSILARLDWVGLRLAVKVNERMKPSPGEPQNRAFDGHSFVELSRLQPLGTAVNLLGRAWWDGARYHSYAVDTAGVRNVDFGVGDVLGTEWRLDWARSAGSALTVGTEGQHYARALIRNYDESPFTLHQERELERERVALYVQSRDAIARRVSLSTGVRLDTYTGIAPVVSPRLGMTWSFGSGVAAHLMAGSSHRVPTLYEINDRANQGSAAPLEPERMMTVEGSLERSAGGWTAQLSAYRNDLRNVIELMDLDTSGNVGFLNRERVLAHGIEGELSMTSRDGNRGRLAIAWQHARDQQTGSELTNSPRWNAHVVVTHAPTDARFSYGGGLRWLSPRLIGDGGRTQDALVADARIGARLRRSTTVGLEVKNLLDARYVDPVGHAPVRDPVGQDPRTLYLTLHHGGWLP